MPFNMNPQQILNLIKTSQNPQKEVMNMLEEQARTNPMANNFLNLARDNNTAEIEKIARNIFKEQGRDFDTEFISFKKSLGL
jgi:predicted metalloprotease